jgi:hypothetical protein
LAELHHLNAAPAQRTKHFLAPDPFLQLTECGAEKKIWVPVPVLLMRLRLKQENEAAEKVTHRKTCNYRYQSREIKKRVYRTGT